MKKRYWFLILIVLLLAAGTAVWGWVLPYRQAGSTMAPGGMLTLYHQSDGVLIQWPEAEGTDRYLVEVLEAGQTACLFSQWVSGQTSQVLPTLPEDRECTIRVTPGAEYSLLFGKEPRIKMGTGLQWTDRFGCPAVTEIQWQPEPGQVTATLELTQGAQPRLYELDGETPVLVESLTGSCTVLSFGEEGRWPIPGYGEKTGFCFDAVREGENYCYYGPMTGPVWVEREDLLGTELELTCTAQDSGGMKPRANTMNSSSENPPMPSGRQWPRSPEMGSEPRPWGGWLPIPVRSIGSLPWMWTAGSSPSRK